MHLLFTAGYSFCTSARKYWAFSARLCEDIIGGADSLFCFSEDIYKKKIIKQLGMQVNLRNLPINVKSHLPQPQHHQVLQLTSDEIIFLLLPSTR
jgi:hypothetical protein